MIAIIASRAASKSFIIAVYSVCRCILRPYSKIVCSSATLKQANLIVTDKIQNELMSWSPMLRKEILEIKKINSNAMQVVFRNHSTFTVCAASENSRGYRSHCLIREECRMIEKNIDDSVLSPMQTTRPAPYMLDDFYKNNKDLLEEPVDIYISSSYYDTPEVWMWGLVDSVAKDMMNGLPSTLLAFDEAAILSAGIKTRKQLIQEKKKQDPLTWKLEFLNERICENTSAFFTYSMLTENQKCKQPFYPKDYSIMSMDKKWKCNIPKQDGEIRIVACDIAFVAGKQNDNSIYTCLRAIPEVMTVDTSTVDGKGGLELKQGYRREVSYIESNQMGDTTLQTLRIRELFEDFNADYIVLDCRNGGVQILYNLGKTLYNESRRQEYEPLKCMNNAEYAKAVNNKFAKECIYAINASQQLNSDIAQSFRRALIEKRIELLLNYSSAKNELLPDIKEYASAVIDGNANVMTFYEKPFVETQLLIKETAELVYEKAAQTGVIKISEQGNNTKDRYTSCSYGNYFIDQLEIDLLGERKRQTFDISRLSGLSRKPKLYKR
ncbi:MAG: hypothetical protein KBT35_05815 [Firmicutes bacterium]|nr:hypothetical protein [Candidatus Colivicinus equi]